MKENRAKGENFVVEINSMASTARTVPGFIKLSPRKDWKKKKTGNLSADKEKLSKDKRREKDNSSCKSEKKLTLAKYLRETELSPIENRPLQKMCSHVPQHGVHPAPAPKQLSPFVPFSTSSEIHHPYQNRTLKFKSNFIKELEQTSGIQPQTTIINNACRNQRGHKGNSMGITLQNSRQNTIRPTQRCQSHHPTSNHNSINEFNAIPEFYTVSSPPSFVFPSPNVSSISHISNYSIASCNGFTGFVNEATYGYSKFHQTPAISTSYSPSQLQLKSTINLDEARVVQTVESDAQNDGYDQSFVVE